MAKDTKAVAVVNDGDAIDIEFMNVARPEDFMDLSELEQPLVKIDTYLDTPVIVTGYEKKVSNDRNRKNQSDGIYYILSVIDIHTGQEWRSSCSHWFMKAYVNRMEEKGKNPFPIAIEFYDAGNDAIKFRGVPKPTQQAF